MDALSDESLWKFSSDCFHFSGKEKTKPSAECPGKWSLEERRSYEMVSVERSQKVNGLEK